MSQSQTKLGQLWMELALAKQSTADALTELKAELKLEKENSDRACAELKAAQESSSQAR